MVIEKNGKSYRVEELTRDWKISIVVGTMPVIFKVAKADYPTLDALKAFVFENGVF